MLQSAPMYQEFSPRRDMSIDYPNLLLLGIDYTDTPFYHNLADRPSPPILLTATGRPAKDYLTFLALATNLPVSLFTLHPDHYPLLRDKNRISIFPIYDNSAIDHIHYLARSTRDPHLVLLANAQHIHDQINFEVQLTLQNILQTGAARGIHVIATTPNNSSIWSDLFSHLLTPSHETGKYYYLDQGSRIPFYIPAI